MTSQGDLPFSDARDLARKAAQHPQPRRARPRRPSSRSAHLDLYRALAIKMGAPDPVDFGDQAVTTGVLQDVLA